MSVLPDEPRSRGIESISHLFLSQLSEGDRQRPQRRGPVVVKEDEQEISLDNSLKLSHAQMLLAGHLAEPLRAIQKYARGVVGDGSGTLLSLAGNMLRMFVKAGEGTVCDTLNECLESLPGHCEKMLIYMGREYRDSLGEMLEHCRRAVVFCGCEPEDVIAGYQEIKWLVTEVGVLTEIAVYVVHGPDEVHRAGEVYDRLNRTVNEFLDIDVERVEDSQLNYQHEPLREMLTIDNADSDEVIGGMVGFLAGGESERPGGSVTEQPEEISGENPPADHITDFSSSETDANVAEIKPVDEPATGIEGETEVISMPNIFDELLEYDQPDECEASGGDWEEEPLETATDKERAAMELQYEARGEAGGKVSGSEQGLGSVPVMCPIEVVRFPGSDAELADLLQLALPVWLHSVASAVALPVRMPEINDKSIRFLLDAAGRIHILAGRISGSSEMVMDALAGRKWLKNNINMIAGQCRQLRVDISLEPGLVLVAQDNVQVLRKSLDAFEFPCAVMQAQKLQTGMNRSMLIF